MLMTETGQDRLNGMFYNSEKISITISPEISKEGNQLKLGVDDKTGIQKFSDGKIKVGEHKITIYEGSIIEALKGNSKYNGLRTDEAIGAVAGHESGHTEKKNTLEGIENRDKQTNHDVEAVPNKIEDKIIEELKKGGQNL